MLLVSLVQIVCSIAAVYFGARAAMGFGRDVRAAIFRRVGAFSAREVARFGAPSLITRNTNDVQQVQMLVLMTCTMLVAAPIMCVGGIIMALREDVGLSWLMLVSVPVLVGRRSALIIRGWCRSSGSCRPGSTRSTGCCASRSPASGWSARSSASRTRRDRFAGANAELTDTALRAGRLHGVDLPDGHAGAERLQRRGALVRRAPGGRRRRSRSAR